MHAIEFARIKHAVECYQRGQSLIEDIGTKTERLMLQSAEKKPIIINFVGTSASVSLSRETSDKVNLAIRQILHEEKSAIRKAMDDIECEAGTVRK